VRKREIDECCLVFWHQKEREKDLLERTRQESRMTTFTFISPPALFLLLSTSLSCERGRRTHTQTFRSRRKEEEWREDDDDERMGRSGKKF
jgi:hypothetical protein